MRKLVSILLSILACLTGCKKKHEGVGVSEGPGSDEDISYLVSTWGVELPEGDCWKVKREDGLMVYMISRDQLQSFQDSLQREWKKLSEKEVYAHPGFGVDGSKDLNVMYCQWEDGSARKMIFVDHSAAVVSFMSFPNQAPD